MLHVQPKKVGKKTREIETDWYFVLIVIQYDLDGGEPRIQCCPKSPTPASYLSIAFSLPTGLGAK